MHYDLFDAREDFAQQDLRESFVTMKTRKIIQKREVLKRPKEIVQD